MNLNAEFSCSLAQTGKVSVSHQHMRGIVMNKVHIQCDCISDSLLSDIACTEVPRDSRLEPNWLSTQLQQSSRNKRGSTANLAPEDKTLVMRVKSVQFRDNELVLTNGEITLQGEDVIVRNGVPYFQSKSQLVPTPSTGPPVLRGSKIDKKRLEALASKKGGSRNLYFSNSKLLDGHGQRPLIEDPEIHFGSQVIPLATVAKTSSTAESISDDVLKKIFPNYERLNDVADADDVAVEPAVKKKASKVGEEAAVESNTVVMANSRCIIKGNSIVALRGLLQVGSAWHPVNDGILIGSDPNANSHPVTISGTPVYKDVTACEQLLLNNVTLYSRGSTVYAGNTALLENAVVHADGKKISVEDLQLVGICGKEPPENPEPARLFVQGGKFTVGESGLDVFDGTVWFKDVKVNIPEDSTEEVRVQDSIVFIPPDSHSDSGANGVSLFENRDIIYKDNMLLLDDLTPLLMGGVMSHGNQQEPLAWLSDDPGAMQRTQSSQVQITPSTDTRCDRDNVLSDGVCILDDTGMYVIEGTMVVNDKKVIVNKGVPLFSPDFSEQDRAKHLEMMPPRLTGRVLLDANGARDLGAKFIKGSTVLKNVNVEIRDGRLIMNQQVPVISDCKLILNQRVHNPSEMGMNPQSEDDGRGSYGVSSEPTDSGRAQVIDKGARKDQNQGVSVNDGSIKPKAPPVDRQAVRKSVDKPNTNIDGLRASDPDDSGRGTSGFDSGLSDNDRTRTNENQEMPEAPRFDVREAPERARTSAQASQSRMSDGRGQDGRMSDGRGQDGRKSDSRGQDSRSSDGRSPDGRMSDRRGPDGRMSDGRMSDGAQWDVRMSEGYDLEVGRRLDSRLADGRDYDRRTPNGRGRKGRMPDGRTQDGGRMPDGREQDGGRMSDGRGQDGRVSDGRSPDGRSTDGRSPDGRSTDGRSPDGGMSDGREQDGGRISDGRSPDGRVSDGRSPDGRVSDGRSPDGRSTDGRSPDGRMSDGRGQDGRISDSRGQDGRSPDSRYQDGLARDSRGQPLDSGKPVDGVQFAGGPRPSDPRRSADGSGGPPRGKASARNRDNVFGPAPSEHQIPRPTLTDEASAGMLGSIWVASNQGNQLMVSLRSRIETNLNFLDGDKGQSDK